MLEAKNQVGRVTAVDAGNQSKFYDSTPVHHVGYGIFL